MVKTANGAIGAIGCNPGRQGELQFSDVTVVRIRSSSVLNQSYFGLSFLHCLLLLLALSRYPNHHDALFQGAPWPLRHGHHRACSLQMDRPGLKGVAMMDDCGEMLDRS